MWSYSPLLKRDHAILAAGSLLAATISGCDRSGAAAALVEERLAAAFQVADNPGVIAGYSAFSLLDDLTGNAIYRSNAMAGLTSNQARQAKGDGTTLDYDNDGIVDLRVMVQAEVDQRPDGGHSEGRITIRVLEPLVLEDQDSGLTWTIDSGSEIVIDSMLSVSDFQDAADRRGIVSGVSHYAGVSMRWSDGLATGKIIFVDGQSTQSHTTTSQEQIRSFACNPRLRVNTGGVERTYCYVGEYTKTGDVTADRAGASFTFTLGESEFGFGPYTVTDDGMKPYLYIETEDVRYGPFTPGELGALAVVATAD